MAHHDLKRDLMRVELAHRAASLMAEYGSADHEYAKRKAARQLGVPETQHLPGNDEIDSALHSLRNLYQSQSHPLILKALRAEALEQMRMLEQFHPYLTGSVLSGLAGAQSDINLLLFSDDAKAVLLFLLRKKLSFADGEWKVHLAGRSQSMPGYTLTGASGVETHLVVLPENAHHSGSRHPTTHADIAALEALLAAS